VLATLLLIGLMAATLVGQRRQAAAVRADLLPALAAIQASAEPRKQDLVRERADLVTKINEQVTRQEGLLPKIRSAEAAIKELEPQVKTLDRAQSKLTETVGALQADQDLTGEGVAVLQAKLADLERTQGRLKEEYKTRFQAMRAAFEAAKEAPEPAAIRQFYATHRQSAFAPAAGFYAAERLYATKHSGDALRLYKEVVRLYPGSVYVESCKGRIAQIDAGGKYSEPAAAAVDFEPYLPEAAASSPAPSAAAETPAAPAEPAP
jgi:hypothetical protein